MSLQQEMRFKEFSPEETLMRIKKILKTINLTVSEKWLPRSSVGTYSLRITINDTKLGTNGKGVTENLARASAYAELLERLQNLWIARSTIRWTSRYKFKYFIDELEITAEEIIASNNAFIKMYFAYRNMSDASFTEKVQAFKKAQKTDYTLFSKKSTYTSIPLYNIKSKKVEYWPYNTYSVIYASNGMCAGNTPEEALVQGFSEILERYIQTKIFKERPTLPDIPDDYLSKYPHVRERFESLKKLEGYTFLLKDCSFGGKYPVAALVVIEQNTGRYGFKLGSHPDYPLAIERCFTEAAQGNDITEYVNRSHLDFKNSRVNDPINIFNCFRIGVAQYPFEIIGPQPTFNFVPVKDVSNKSNGEILRNLVNELMDDGYDILIRDVSYLGFPSYHVIVPGMSEMMYMTDQGFSANNTRLFVSELLNKPEKIEPKFCKHIIGILDYYANSFMDNEMRSHYGVLVNIPVPAEEIQAGWLFLSVMCNVMLQNYSEAATRMEHVVKLADDNDTRKVFYRAVYHYLSGMAVMRDHIKTIRYLENFFDGETCTQIDELFCDPLKVIIKQYLPHDYSDRSKCRELGCCDYHVYADCIDTLKEFQMSNPINQSNLMTLFN